MPDDFLIPLGQVPVTVDGQTVTVDGAPVTFQGPLTGLASECHAVVKVWRLEAPKLWRLEVAERC